MKINLIEYFENTIKIMPIKLLYGIKSVMRLLLSLKIIVNL